MHLICVKQIKFLQSVFFEVTSFAQNVVRINYVRQRGHFYGALDPYHIINIGDGVQYQMQLECTMGTTVYSTYIRF